VFDRAQSDTLGEIEADLGTPLCYQESAAAAAAAAAYEVPIYKVPSQATSATVIRLSIVAAVAIAAVATNLQTLRFRQWRAGAFLANLGTTYATSAALAVQTELALFTISATQVPVVLQPGDIITLQSVTSGTGAALPILLACAEVGITATGPVV